MSQNRKVNTPNVQAKLQVSREISRHTSSRQVSPPALTLGSDRVHLSLPYARQKQIIDIQDSGTPKKSPPPQLPTLVLGNLDYTERAEQTYHTGRNGRCNIDEYSELSIDTAEHISGQLHKAALMIRKSKKNNSDLSDYTSLTSSLVQFSKQSTK